MPNTTVSTLSDATGQKILNAISSGVFAVSTMRNIGELVFSSLPLSDASLVLADGDSQGLARGAYADFYDYVYTQYNLGSSAILTKSDWDTEKAANNGIIGKYGIDTSAQKVYVPNLMDTFIEGTNSELGTFKAAGVPNLKGKLTMRKGATPGYQYDNNPAIWDNNGFITTIATDLAVRTYNTSGQTYGSDSGAVEFNASNASPVYSDSATTVQPQAVKQYIYIVVANAYKSPVTINIDNVMTDIASINDTLDSMTWKELVTNHLGRDDISLPSGWKEIIAKIHIGGISSPNFDYSFYVIKEFCSTNAITYFRSGSYSTSSEYTGVCLGVRNANSIFLDDAYFKGVDYDTTSYITAYYK